MENAQGALTFVFFAVPSMMFMWWAMWKISRQDRMNTKADEQNHRHRA